MFRNLFGGFVGILVALILSFSVNAAQLDKVSKERDQILISPELGEQFQVGDRVCVEGRSWKKVCGKVTRKKGSKAIAKMEEVVEGARRGDPVDVERSKRALVNGEEDGWGGSDWNTEDNRSQRRYSKRKTNGLDEVAFLVQAGVTSPRFHSVEAPVSYDKFLVRGTFGLGFNIPFDRGTFSFEPTLNYHTKGGEYEETGITGGSPLRYLELPLLFKIRFSNEEVSPYFLLGPYISYLLSARFYAQGLGQSVDNDIKESTKDFDFGLMSGLGIDFALSSSSRLGFQFLASWGLIDLAKEEGGPYHAKNRHLGLLVNIAFNL